MTMPIGLTEIIEALRQAGIREGDTLNIHSRLFTVGLLRDVTSASDIPGVYLRAFQEVLGSSGTLVVPTYTTSFGRLGKPFSLEESPSEMGVFSETVRTTADSRRTLHPIQSLAALGAQAEPLTRDHPRWNVGHGTIWDRMHKLRTKVVTVGIPLRQCLSFVHHAEFLACAPYLYHKLLRGEVYAGGVKIRDPFLMSARYLRCGIAYDLSRMEAELIARGAVRQCPLGVEQLRVVSMDAVFEVCMKGFRKDPYYLLKNPPRFTEGEIPCDGVTGGREEAIPSYFEILK